MNKYTKWTEPSPHRPEIRLGDGLILVNLLNVLLTLAFVFWPSGLLGMILSVPYLLFFPGYTLLAAIFVREEEISGVERAALSVGLSFIIVVLIGLFLNYTTWGIRLEPALYSISGFVFLTSVITWLRRRGLAKNERFTVALNMAWLNWGRNSEGKVLTVTLVIAILGALSYLGYLAATPRAGETFSEFFLLGQTGRSVDYPDSLRVGEEGRVYVGIVNHEGKEVSYLIRVLTGDNESFSAGPVLLADGQNWEGEVSFRATSPEEDKKFEFVLYRDGEDTSYKKLHLWIDIIE